MTRLASKIRRTMAISHRHSGWLSIERQNIIHNRKMPDRKKNQLSELWLIASTVPRWKSYGFRVVCGGGGEAQRAYLPREWLMNGTMTGCRDWLEPLEAPSLWVWSDRTRSKSTSRFVNTSQFMIFIKSLSRRTSSECRMLSAPADINLKNQRKKQVCSLFSALARNNRVCLVNPTKDYERFGWCDKCLSGHFKDSLLA